MRYEWFPEGGRVAIFARRFFPAAHLAYLNMCYLKKHSQMSTWVSISSKFHAVYACWTLLVQYLILKKI